MSVSSQKAEIEGYREWKRLRSIMLRFVSKCIFGNALQTDILLTAICSGRSENAKVAIGSLRNKFVSLLWTKYVGPYYNATKNEYLRTKYLYEVEQNKYLSTATSEQLIARLWQLYSMKLSHTLRYSTTNSVGKTIAKHPQLGLIHIEGPQDDEFWLYFPKAILAAHPEIEWHDPLSALAMYQLRVAVVGAEVGKYRLPQDQELTYCTTQNYKVAIVDGAVYVEVTDLVPERYGGRFVLVDDTVGDEPFPVFGFVMSIGTSYLFYDGESPHYSIPEAGTDIVETGLERYIEAYWQEGVSEDERKEYSGGFFWFGTRYPDRGEHAVTSFVKSDVSYLTARLAEWPYAARGDGITRCKRDPSESASVSVKKNLEVWVPRGTFVPSVLEKD